MNRNQPNQQIPTPEIRVWKAYLTQAGTADPTVTELQNTLDSIVTVTRDEAGKYKVNAEGKFLVGKTNVYLGHSNAAAIFTEQNQNADYIKIYTYTTGYADDLLQGTSIFIEVFQD